MQDENDKKDDVLDAYPPFDSNAYVADLFEQSRLQKEAEVDHLFMSPPSIEPPLWLEPPSDSLIDFTDSKQVNSIDYLFGPKGGDEMSDFEVDVFHRPVGTNPPVGVLSCVGISVQQLDGTIRVPLGADGIPATSGWKWTKKPVDSDENLDALANDITRALSQRQVVGDFDTYSWRA